MTFPHLGPDFFRIANSYISEFEALIARILFALAALKGVLVSVFPPKKPPS
jgi:hypothetical protein